MENQSDFIPTPEFLKSEIGIPIERNFPAGLTSFNIAKIHIFDIEKITSK
jgi:hypothetical protein